LTYLKKIFIIIIVLFLDFSEIISVDNKQSNKKLHPVHLTFTNVEYIEAQNQFKILFKIFIDDFDNIIFKKYGFKLGFEKKEKPKNYEKIISKYINEHFKIIINNKIKLSLKYNYHKFKENEPTFYLYFLSKYKGDIKTVKITNSLMTDLFLDQKNLLIFNYKKIQKAIKFDNKKINVRVL